MSTKTHIDALTGIRAIAAAWVVLLHFREPILLLAPGRHHWDPVVLSGYLGVDVFFVLSGFVISYNYLDRLSQFSWKQTRGFIGLRIARIYPVHLTMLVAVGVLAMGAKLIGIAINGEATYSIRNFAMNVLMIQSVPPGDSWNPPAWSISVEFGAYLAFPLLALVLARIRGWRVAFTVAVALVAVAHVLFVQVADEAKVPGYTFAWTRIAVEFTLGCLLFVGWRYLGPHSRGRGWDIAAVVGAVAVFVSIAVSDIDRVMFVPGLTILGIALFVLATAGATGPLHTFFASRTMVWGGRISYSVYMTHFLIATVLGKLVDWQQLADWNWGIRVAVLTACFALVVGVGAGCYSLVEEPGRRYLRRRVQARPVSGRGR